jgi:dihydrofolate reductase
MRKLIYYVGMSIDGKIAGPAGEIDFYPLADTIEWIGEEYPEALPAHARAQLGISADPPRHFDTGVMGRATYDPALELGIASPYAPMRQVVFSRTLGPSPDPSVTVTSDDPVAVVRDLKAREGRDIYLIGGAQLAGQLLTEIDGLVIKLYPVVAGAGVPLFTADFAPTMFRLVSSRALAGGTVILTYDRA